MMAPAVTRRGGRTGPGPAGKAGRPPGSAAAPTSERTEAARDGQEAVARSGRTRAAQNDQEVAVPNGPAEAVRDDRGVVARSGRTRAAQGAPPGSIRGALGHP